MISRPVHTFLYATTLNVSFIHLLRHCCLNQPIQKSSAPNSDVCSLRDLLPICVLCPALSQSSVAIIPPHCSPLLLWSPLGNDLSPSHPRPSPARPPSFLPSARRPLQPLPAAAPDPYCPGGWRVRPKMNDLGPHVARPPPSSRSGAQNNRAAADLSSRPTLSGRSVDVDSRAALLLFCARSARRRLACVSARLACIPRVLAGLLPRRYNLCLRRRCRVAARRRVVRAGA